MGSITTKITNSSDVGVKISLTDKDGRITDQEIEPNETCSIKSPEGIRTVMIVKPIQDRNFMPCYTLSQLTSNLIVIKQEGYLTLKRCKKDPYDDALILDKFLLEMSKVERSKPSPSEDHIDFNESMLGNLVFEIIFNVYLSLSVYLSLFLF